MFALDRHPCGDCFEDEAFVLDHLERSWRKLELASNVGADFGGGERFKKPGEVD